MAPFIGSSLHIPLRHRRRTSPFFKVTARYGFIAALVCALLIPLAGCSREEPPVKVDLSKREAAARVEAGDVISYAYLPQYSHIVSYRRHRLMVEYLQRETGLNIKQIYPGTFDHHMQMVGRGEIDISYYLLLLMERLGLVWELNPMGPRPPRQRGDATT